MLCITFSHYNFLYILQNASCRDVKIALVANKFDLVSKRTVMGDKGRSVGYLSLVMCIHLLTLPLCTHHIYAHVHVTHILICATCNVLVAGNQTWNTFFWNQCSDWWERDWTIPDTGLWGLKQSEPYIHVYSLFKKVLLADTSVFCGLFFGLRGPLLACYSNTYMNTYAGTLTSSNSGSLSRERSKWSGFRVQIIVSCCIQKQMLACVHVHHSPPFILVKTFLSHHITKPSETIVYIAHITQLCKFLSLAFLVNIIISTHLFIFHQFTVYVLVFQY